MIVQDKMKIVANQGNVRVIKKSHVDVKMGEEYIIDVKNLSIGSHIQIKVKCDFCDYVRYIQYKEYVKNVEKDGYYYCSCCSPKKVKNTCVEKYGVNCYFQTDISKNSIKEKYGCDNVFQNEEIKKLSKETKMIKYNNTNFNNIEKHRKTIMEKYGVNNISKSTLIKQKKIDTCLKNWGVKYPSQNKEILEKMIFTTLKNRTYDLSDYKTYRYKVVQLTNKNKKKLLEDWDGIDYYDNEYILENFNNFKSTDREYPTIDHKISIIFSYLNNISIDNASSIENLCITKKYINSTKNRKNEKDFKFLFQFN